MSNYIKFFMIIICVLISMFIVGLSRFYRDMAGTSPNVQEPYKIIRTVKTDEAGNIIFEGENGFYGVMDAFERVIVEPQWSSLQFGGNSYLIATRNINGQLLIGCTDFNENVTVPFIHSNIKQHKLSDETVVYVGTLADNGGLILYSKDFVPYFNRCWDSIDLSGNDITVKSGNGTFTYTVSDSVLVFKNASVDNSAVGINFVTQISSRITLSKLNFGMIEQISHDIASYLNSAFTEKEARTDFMTFNIDSKSVIETKLSGIKNLSVYNSKDEGKQQYFIAKLEVQVAVTYYDPKSYGDSETSITTTRSYTANIKFKSTGDSISMISGGFSDLSFSPDISDKTE